MTDDKRRSRILIGLVVLVGCAVANFTWLNNGRYQPVVVSRGDEGGLLYIIDTRTGGWSVVHYRYQNR